MTHHPSFANVRLNVLSLQVELTPSEDGSSGYEIRSRHPGGIRHETADSTLRISEKIFSPHRILRMLDRLLGAETSRIVIRVPREETLGEVGLTNVGGGTDIHGLTCRALEVRTTSGNVAVSASGAECFSARQTSGRLTVDDCALDAADIGSSSGAVELTNTRTGGLTIHTTSGKAVVAGVPGGRTDIRTSSGAILLDIADRMENYDLDVGVSGGAIYVDGRKHGKAKLTQTGRRDGGGNALRLKTAGGDVKLNFH